jgi:prepilin-type N-terminal cleavage/methylation domain-containing protein
MMKIKQEDGFTLIEIIAVMVIMGILAAVAVSRFFDLQGRAREKAVYTAMAELKSRVNSHFCSDLLDGKTPDAITYTGSEVGTWLSNDFLIENWDESDPNYIEFDLTYYPDPTDHSKNPLVKGGIRLSKPQFGL